MENSEVPENSEQIPEISENKEEKKAEPKNTEAESEQKTPVAAKPKGRGRPKGALTPSHALSEFP